MKCLHSSAPSTTRFLKRDGTTAAGSKGCGCYPVSPCAVHGEHTLPFVHESVRSCYGCDDYRKRNPMPVEHKTVDVAAPIEPTPGPTLSWAVGMTTVPSRLAMFSATLDSVIRAGFPPPWVCVDGDDGRPWTEFDGRARGFTIRSQPARTAGNWLLTLTELWVRSPLADRYAVFQDDFVFCARVREYLDAVPYPAGGYLNLYTFPSNHAASLRKIKLPAPADDYRGFYRANQLGKGAVALVFDRRAARTILTSEYLADRFMDPDRGHRAVDGGIVEAFKAKGITEYVHFPSLTQHVGVVSSMGNRPHIQAPSFPGEGFDATTLLPRGTVKN